MLANEQINVKESLFIFFFQDYIYVIYIFTKHFSRIILLNTVNLTKTLFQQIKCRRRNDHLSHRVVYYSTSVSTQPVKATQTVVVLCAWQSLCIYFF